MKILWPYILPLPVKREELNRVFQTVFGTRAALEILKRTSPNQKMYQKELISELGFSNKTIIEALKRLVSAGVLEQGMEKREVKQHTLWVKWYMPTVQGKWLALLLQSPASLTPEEARKIIVELFMLYLENILKLGANYNIELDFFESKMHEAALKMVQEATFKKDSSSRVIVFGSAAMDTTIVDELTPGTDEIRYISDVQEYPGGSAANTSIALRRLGIAVSFVGKLGGDAGGVQLMKEFQAEKVDISGIIIERGKKTIKTFITIDNCGNKRIYVLGGENSALSISSPNEVDWKKIEDSEIVYIGEVFVEIAELIASCAKSWHKKVIYRPGLPILKVNAERVRGILRNVDMLILNTQGLETINKNLDPTNIDLLKTGVQTIIVTNGVNGCSVFTQNETFTMPAVKSKVVDTTGAGDAFTAGLIYAILDSKSLKDCLRYALIVSAIKISKKGARTALPSRSEVEEYLTHHRNEAG